MDKARQVAKDAGIKVVYSGLILYYALDSPKTPMKSKLQIYAALGYLILPIDLVPDFIPVVGYVDDLGALGLAIGATAMSIDSEVKQKAKDKVSDFFGEAAMENKDIIDVDSQIDEDGI